MASLKEVLKVILADLIPELNKVTINYLTNSGLKPQSNLVKQTEFVETSTGLALMSAYYFQYRSDGRKRGVRKVPITALIDYIKRYGIAPKGGQTITSLAFAIQTAIYKRGIMGLNYFDKIIEATSDITEQVIADEISEELADQIVDLMTITPYGTEVN